MAGCERIWTDTASGKLARRPEWDKCLDYLRAGDELVITRLSRMCDFASLVARNFGR
jgi:DNA invertase Pin-like site-specific DNA recombinase